MARHRNSAESRSGSSERHLKNSGNTSAAAAAQSQPFDVRWLVGGGVAALIAFAWAYWPALVQMVSQWVREPDYSHGFIVLPIAVFFLWSKRSRISADMVSPSLYGVLVLAVAAVLRVAAGKYYLEPVDAWTMPLWIAGSVWLLFGWTILRWALPAIAFLWFMIPIPYSAETMLSMPLQSIATKISTAFLVMLGQPALAEGNTIWIGEHQLFIEEACSGLRILVGIFALAFAFVFFSSWTWWQKGLVLLAALPIALIANAMRIVATGLLYQFVSSEAGKHFSHDLSGIVMIPIAAALFWLFLVYLERLFPEVESLSVFDVGIAQ